MKGHLLLAVGLLGVLLATQQAIAAPATKPNILVIFGDDIGIANISAYSDGLMGYETPNIDRIAQGGPPLPALLRRAELHRRPRGVPHRPARHPHRPDQGRLPRRADGHEPADPSIGGVAEEPRLRDRPVRQEPRRRSQRSLPTVNGFDEFFGNLYHLNAEEEPELPDYPKDPAYLRKFGPRGVLQTARRPTRTIRPSIRASARSASRRSRTPAR